ncbi:MAG: DUF4252 domain-containing protein [Bacteroidales bacterium]
MKRLLLMMVLSAAITAIFAQRSVDDLFDRYAGRKGFVTVTLSGDLLKLSCLVDDDNDKERLDGKITEIRVLAQDDDDMNVDNFYDLVIKDINTRGYEEYMRVKKSDQDLKMLVRTEGRRFREFLLIGGGEDNFIVQVKGDLSMKDAEKFSSDVKRDNGRNLFSGHN